MGEIIHSVEQWTPCITTAQEGVTVGGAELKAYIRHRIYESSPPNKGV